MVKILIVRLSSLGDIIHTYPMIYDIKQNIRECRIDWLVDESFTELVELNQLVDNVITIPLRNWKKNKLTFWANFRKWRSNISAIKYDYIIDVQGLIKSSVLARFFDGKIYGFGKKSIREKLARFLYDFKIEIGRNMLALTKNRLLAASIFNYKFDSKHINFGLSSNKHIRSNIDSKYVIFFHATSKKTKRYPTKQWAELANYLIEKHNFKILLPFGNNSEKEESWLIKNLINFPNNVVVAENRFTYTELSSLIYYAEFIFGVDTGLVHLANALNKKLIAIYVDTNPGKTGVFESSIAKNLGNISEMPTLTQLINKFETIMRV